MSNEELPSFDIIKDIFLTIDTRKDGFIDQNEWINTFAKFKIDTVRENINNNNNMNKK